MPIAAFFRTGFPVKSWFRFVIVSCSLVFGSSLMGAESPTKSTDNGSPLANAASPYLRLHAPDLVKWNEWGDAAFDEAKASNKLLMVSFGYTACHWCHVMQRSHFNNPAMAKFINENFVPIMVDRERRPALDDTYMVVTETLTRRGGWPNTVFMTPNKKPVYGTAYIPPEAFQNILNILSDEWANNRAAASAEADRLSEILSNYLSRSEKAAKITPEVLSAATRELLGGIDEFNGGFGDAPKFFRSTYFDAFTAAL